MSTPNTDDVKHLLGKEDIVANQLIPNKAAMLRRDELGEERHLMGSQQFRDNLISDIS